MQPRRVFGMFNNPLCFHVAFSLPSVCLPLFASPQPAIYSKILPAGAMAESADATDLKSVVGNNVRVRPPLAPLNVIA